MGAAASLSAEHFTLAKEEYELRKNDGLTDEQLFNHMKDFIESKQGAASATPVDATNEKTNPEPTDADADGTATAEAVPAHAEAVETVVAVAVPVAETEAEKPEPAAA